MLDQMTLCVYALLLGFGCHANLHHVMRNDVLAKQACKRCCTSICRVCKMCMGLVSVHNGALCYCILVCSIACTCDMAPDSQNWTVLEHNICRTASNPAWHDLMVVEHNSTWLFCMHAQQTSCHNVVDTF